MTKATPYLKLRIRDENYEDDVELEEFFPNEN